VNGRIPVISITGFGVYIFLSRNDGNDATRVRADQELKVQYFYWCFPFTLAKIELGREHAREEMVFWEKLKIII
jgi:hypothetical protein